MSKKIVLAKYPDARLRSWYGSTFPEGEPVEYFYIVSGGKKIGDGSTPLSAWKNAAQQTLAADAAPGAFPISPEEENEQRKQEAQCEI